MMHLQFGSTTRVYLTLQELVTLTSPHYLFVFTARAADRVVAVVLAPVSSNDRAERFELDTDTIFAGCEPGRWNYQVYEQAGAVNTDPAQAGRMLEVGIVQLHAATVFSFTQRTTITEFIQPQ